MDLVVQSSRNEHNLLKDFQDEVPGYLANGEIVRLLEDQPLELGPKLVGANLLKCYEALIKHGILPREERSLIKAWLRDLKLATGGLVL